MLDGFRLSARCLRLVHSRHRREWWQSRTFNTGDTASSSMSPCSPYIIVMVGLKYITMTSQWVRWRPKSHASTLFPRKHQRAASLAVFFFFGGGGIHRWPVNCSRKGPVMQKIFPFDDVIMASEARRGADRCLHSGISWKLQPISTSADTSTMLTSLAPDPETGSGVVAFTYLAAQLKMQNHIYWYTFCHL